MPFSEARNTFVMGAYIKKAHVERQFIRIVENEFNRMYPFLKIEFSKNADGKQGAPAIETPDDEILRSRAKHMLVDELKLSDATKVNELEAALQQVFDNPVQVLRKSGNFWIETRMTRDWTLKQQNDHGRELI
jgi:hypothetical protein